ncbi:MAG: ABC transporter substrate-binding protein [Kiritimatiellia bacterium]
MQKTFIIVPFILVIASLVNFFTQPDQQTDRPVLYWKSDANPQRYEQIELFHEWLVENGHTAPDGGPAFYLQLDAANNQSKLIQAVSGVGGDILDAGVSGYQPLGVLRDLTQEGKEMGFGVENTYQGLAHELTHNGKLYAYPCNVTAWSLWCNVDTFERYGMEPPPESWTVEEFERIGREFVRRAKEQDPDRRVFFIMLEPGRENYVIMPMLRSQGLDMFNETLTACILDDPRYVELLKRLQKWIDEGLLPSSSDLASQTAESGYGGGKMSGLYNGSYGMIVIGRWSLIRLREYENPPRLSLSSVPSEGFENLILTARTATLYAGSDHPELAVLFFKYMADRSYNEFIIEGSDGLPPNPEFAVDNPAYLSPPDHPNEGNTHALELKWAQTIGLPNPHSPYYKSTGQNWSQYGRERFLNGLSTAEEAAAETQKRMNAAIQVTLEATPGLRPQYEADRKLQVKIDALKTEGKPIPREWIRNPFYVDYYRSIGQLLEPEQSDE